MPFFLIACGLLALLLHGGIFGFFLAWVCSTMWGLDATDPRTALAAMQAMNASVRNMVFFPFFLLTPVIGVLFAFALWRRTLRTGAICVAVGALIYALGGMALTMLVNVPMNEALALVDIPQDVARADELWQAYSAPWQFWNVTRTILSGLAFSMTGVEMAFAAFEMGKRAKAA